MLVVFSTPLSAQTSVVQASDTLGRQVRDSVPSVVEMVVDTLRADSLRMEGMAADSLHTDTLCMERVVPDTLRGDFLRPDTIAGADSLLVDSLRKTAAPPKKKVVKKKKPTLSKFLSQYCVLKQGKVTIRYKLLALNLQSVASSPEILCHKLQFIIKS